ncbi:hypothetical protein F3C99_14200 [Vitellibacter sp. q18]|nr:hypothetical protein [Aequorivita lutea]
MAREARTANSSYKKLAVQWLYEALCFVSSSLMADSFVLRNRQLLVAANRKTYFYQISIDIFTFPPSPFSTMSNNVFKVRLLPLFSTREM